MNEKIPLRDLCRGRWKGILPAIGIDVRHLSGRHGPCPMCGGHDRFRFDDKDGRGTWICSQCGAGDGIALAMRINHWDFKDAAERLPGLAGASIGETARRERSQESLRESMNRLWKASLPLSDGDAVVRYLEQRGIHLETYPKALRYHEKCKYIGGENPRWFPAMVAKITAPDGAPSNLHRTFLSDDAAKAPVDDARRVMPGPIAKGGAIRLAPAGPVMGIAEGIETALAASIIWRVPCWAAVNATMMMSWEPPPEASEIIVFGDNDTKYGGQMAAYALAHRLKCGPRKFDAVRVEMPIDIGMDWNDALMADKAAA